MVYVPVVKGSKYDLMAVGRVNKSVRTAIKPFVEAMPVDPQKPSIDEHVYKLCSGIRKHLPLGELFVDFYGLMPDDIVADGTNAIIHGFRLLKGLGRPVTPVFGFERNDELWDGLGAIAREFGKGFCFRLSRDDLDEYQFDDVWSQIIERSAQMNIPHDQIDLMLDYRHIDAESVKSLAENVISFLFHNPDVAQFRSVVVAGSSALKSVAEIEKDGMGEVVRQELHLWSFLWRDMPDNFKPIFGDYGVIHPDFSNQSPSKYVNAKIRYTVGDKIVYYRGHALHFPDKDYEQYHELASRVIADRRYVGRDKSDGDKCIDDCAKRMIGPGALGTWVAADMNHHVCYSARQMARLIQKLQLASSEQDVQVALIEH
ncbi:hypothetical protein QPK29_025320 [Massilia sp. YIM B02787]|uniref:Uncharacterized protein n=1 Tax=Massilia orientalis TaxID=3050128 RepID=A0ACC7MHG5_9BURK|nr:hypothetical protein [Massilia sp. YIM B02787]